MKNQINKLQQKIGKTLGVLNPLVNCKQTRLMRAIFKEPSVKSEVTQLKSIYSRLEVIEDSLHPARGDNKALKSLQIELNAIQRALR